MAVTERKNQFLGQGVTKSQTPTWYGGKQDNYSYYDVYGTLLDYSVEFGGKTVYGTYNPSTLSGDYLAQSPAQLNAAKSLLSEEGNFALGTAQTAVDTNTSDNPFFSEFFNYYLGLAQERQAALQKNLSKGDLTAGSSSSASMVGGSLL